jgi:hypothetical protein
MENAAAPQALSEPKIAISVEQLLFGAIALNLIFLMCFTLLVGVAVVGAIIYSLFSHYLRGVTLFYLGVAGLAIVSQLAQFFWWGARGFVELKLFRILTVGLFFILFGIGGMKTGIVDGYVALGTVGVTVLVIIANHWPHVRSYLPRWWR